ncbi:hypothetical protein OIU76_009247 [Salix suchowensis]|nr:hypothetical protein OIU76_009247 [Salix suchowensis]
MDMYLLHFMVALVNLRVVSLFYCYYYVFI